MTNRQRAKWYITASLIWIACWVPIFVGCPPTTEDGRQEEMQMEEDLQSLVGKKIIAVSSSNPMTIHVEGGGSIVINCPQRASEITVKPAKGLDE